MSLNPYRSLDRRDFLRATGASLAATFFAGCGGGSSSSSTKTLSSYPLNPQPVPTGPTTSLTLNVASTRTGSIGDSFCGLSYEKSTLSSALFASNNAPLINLFGLLGPSLLRVGGNSVDQTLWTANGKGQTSGQVAPADVTALAGFLNATGWKMIYGINLATSTPALAAAEVAFAAAAFGSSLHSIEIGNEPDLYNRSYFPSTWGYSNYIALYQSFAAAILATTPAAPLAGPATSYQLTWFQSFASAESGHAKILTHHYYRGDGAASTSTAQALVSFPDATLITDLQSLAASSATSKIPFRLGETNSYYGGGALGVSDTYASALWSLDHLFTIASNGGGGANFHGGGNSAGYTPIANNGATIVGPRPLFYGLLFFNLIGQGSLLQTTLSATQLNVSAYAVQSPTGIHVVLVNKDVTQTINLALTLPTSLNTATLTLMSNNSLTATTGTTIQGATISNTGVFDPFADFTLVQSGSQVSCFVPPLSAALIKIT